MKSISLFLTLTILALQMMSQPLTQTVRGTVTDMLTSAPLAGATILLMGSEPTKGTFSDESGEFQLDGVPIGRQTIKISYIGYLEVVLPAVQVNTGKEVVLDILLEESVSSTDEVVISANKAKDKPLNEMSTVSTRTFDLEETSRYAGSRNDPSRMASNYAGVSGANDSRNDIIIRGNSPTGLLWRLEGVNIPNPNHYGATGATGGPVSMLNNNALSRSDFMTAAFPAQYGNAVAGVFDLNMRNGNNKEREFLGQIGFNGFELGAEGPFSANSKASYMVNYRYSTLGLFQALGVEFGTGAAVPEYQDINFKVDIPSKKAGRFSIFGLGGVSSIDLLGSETDTSQTDLFGGENADLRPRYRTGIVGIKHKLLLNEKTAQQITLAASQAWESVSSDSLSLETREPVLQFGGLNQTNKYSLIYQLNHKFNARDNIRTGVYLDYYDYLFEDSVLSANGVDFRLNTNSDGGSLFSQAYIQWQHKFTDQLVLNSGINALHFALNNSTALEPRLGFRYQVNPTQSFNFGYGLHNQLQPIRIYFQESIDENGEMTLSNKNLDFTNSHHFVLAYDHKIASNLRLKAEVYAQFLGNVPVDTFSSSFSLLNAGADFALPNRRDLQNEGIGRNYGVELTLEKFFSNNYYFLLTGSLFQAEYQGSDKIWRNTAFNGGYVFNALAGKEFPLGNGKSSITIDWKATLAGGRYVTPIDLESSRLARQEVRFDDQAFSEKLDDYFRTDVKLGFRLNSKRITQEFSIDIQNVTNRRNLFSRTFNPRTGQVSVENQLGLFVIPQFRILF
ncbi:MAG: TonB-dependent receptor [Bacteroidia bacterium]|nr:TonB-dependent receptor [Bacteroidia bacterium]